MKTWSKRGGFVFMLALASAIGCDRKVPQEQPSAPAVEELTKQKSQLAPIKPVQNSSGNEPATTANNATSPTGVAASPKVTSVVGQKNAFWSPWKIPGLEALPIPATLPSILPSLPSALPWPNSIPVPTGTVPSALPSPGKKMPNVILYGADWCGACKQAKAHITSRAIKFTYRDVDNPESNAEMSTKVKKAGEKQGAIPVTDIENDLLVGWSSQTFDKMYDEKAK